MGLVVKNLWKNVKKNCDCITKMHRIHFTKIGYYLSKKIFRMGENRIWVGGYVKKWLKYWISFVDEPLVHTTGYNLIRKFSKIKCWCGIYRVLQAKCSMGQVWIWYVEKYKLIARWGQFGYDKYRISRRGSVWVR